MADNAFAVEENGEHDLHVVTSTLPRFPLSFFLSLLYLRVTHLRKLFESYRTCLRTGVTKFLAKLDANSLLDSLRNATLRGIVRKTAYC